MKIFSKKAAVALAACLIVIVLDCALVAYNPVYISRINELIYDAWMANLPQDSPHPAPIIVDIDEKSLGELGQWPWPRHILARLIDKALSNGASAVGLDVILSEPDRLSPNKINSALEKDFGAKLNLDALPQEALDYDVYFSETIKGKPVVLGAFARFGESAGKPAYLPKPTGLAEKTPKGAPKPRDTISKASDLLPPLPLFKNNPVGFTNASLQSDGVVRKTPLLIQIENNIYAGLALRTLMAGLGKKTLRLNSDLDGLASFQVGNINIPVAHDGSFYPVYSGPAKTYPYYSAADFINDKISPEDLQGRIVFIGSSAIGLGDIRSTPLDPVMPGVEIHATIIDNILSGKSIITPAWAAGFQVILIIISTLVALAIFGLLPGLISFLLGLALLASCFLASFLAFREGVFISPAYAVLAIVLIGAIILPLRFWAEAAAKKQLKRAFSRYVAPEVVKKIVKGGGKPLAGEQKEVSVLFTDVRGFTGISEKLTSDRLVALLNHYFTPMTACVKENEGTLDKFIGDALMAFWNAPLDVKNHPYKAVISAMEMRRRLAELRPKFLRDFGVEVNIGAGIHKGIAQVGNMGSNELLDYTCIGRTVNTASRLEGLCKYYGQGIVVSEPVASACGDKLKFLMLDRVYVKGSDDPVSIYTPLESEIDDKILNKWRDSLNLWLEGAFKAALPAFKELAAFPILGKVATVFINRCQNFITSPPENWNGVWKHDSK